LDCGHWFACQQPTRVKKHFAIREETSSASKTKAVIKGLLDYTMSALMFLKQAVGAGSKWSRGLAAKAVNDIYQPGIPMRKWY
jgi:hypothetical protein